MVFVRPELCWVKQKFRIQPVLRLDVETGSVISRRHSFGDGDRNDDDVFGRNPIESHNLCLSGLGAGNDARRPRKTCPVYGLSGLPSPPGGADLRKKWLAPVLKVPDRG